MPAADLRDAFETARDCFRQATDGLVPLLIQMAIATVADVLPGTTSLEVLGEMNEDWAYTLRIQRVLDGDGQVVYAICDDHGETVESAITEAEMEYLDLLLDLTGEDYLGRHVLDRSATAASPGGVDSS